MAMNVPVRPMPALQHMQWKVVRVFKAWSLILDKVAGFEKATLKFDYGLRTFTLI